MFHVQAQLVVGHATLKVDTLLPKKIFGVKSLQRSLESFFRVKLRETGHSSLLCCLLNSSSVNRHRLLS